MLFRHTIFLLLFLCLAANAQDTPPPEARKYHRALLEHPHNATLFNRFYDSWIDTQPIETLEAFLTNRATSDGGIHHALLARYQLRRGNDAAALESLTKAHESRPHGPTILIERAKIRLRLRQFPRARHDLTAVIALDDPALAIEAGKLIGKSHLREGNPGAAIQAWEKLLAQHPKDENLLEDLVELTAASEQYPQALALSKRLIAASSDPFKKTIRQIRRGELFAKSGQTDPAIALWTKTLSQTGEGSWLEREILAQIEQTYRRLDRLDLLAEKFTELATAHPRRLVIHRKLAQLEAANGDIDSAIGRFREVLRRSPGQPEIRETFIRLLIDSDRLDDATAELEKMIATRPDNAELHLRMADLTHRKAQAIPDPDTSSSNILDALTTAHQLLDPTEASSLRIAKLMLRYDLNDPGEALLKSLAAKPDASSAPAEALATEYIRTERIPEAVALLTEIANAPDRDTVLRATAALAPITEANETFAILQNRLADFPNDPTFLTAFVRASLAAEKPNVPAALKLVRSSQRLSEISTATRLATTLITSAEKTDEIIAKLQALPEPSTPETCLLAALLDHQKNHRETDALFAQTSDPTRLRFHASLLSARRDFPAAIATLNRLADRTNDPGYFKQLTSLQLRAGQTDACHKTLDQWKSAAPTDKTPWTIAANLLQDSGKLDAAIQTTRQALTRFQQDDELTARLAMLYQQTDQHHEAERIYWKLYDRASDPAAQTRWAARLAALSRAIGRTAALEEKFLQRSRTNRLDLGPILSLVELARATGDRDAVLVHLRRALRLKPDAIDIRLQLATEEQAHGNLEKQISILTDGLDRDPANRIHTALARAHIDQGRTLKGLRILRSLDSERATDPRLIESTATAIADKGLLPEAIQYLRESLPENPDWRARFLLATLLDRDGREPEAIPIFLSLLEAEKEIPNLTSSRHRATARQNHFPSDKKQSFNQLLQAARSEAQRNVHRHNQQPQLPTSPLEVRLLATVRLARIASLGDPEFKATIDAANIPEIALVRDILTTQSNGEIDYLALFAKHPDQPVLLRYAVGSVSASKVESDDIAILKQALNSPELNPALRARIYRILIHAEPTNDNHWQSMLLFCQKQIASEPSQHAQGIYRQIYALFRTKEPSIPTKYRSKFQTLLLTCATGDQIPEARRTQYRLNAYAIIGDMDAWIDTYNQSLAAYREKLADHLKKRRENWSNQSSQHARQRRFLRQSGEHNLPITSMPQILLRYIPSSSERPASNQPTTQDFLANAERFNSPLVRAWIAIQSNDDKAIEKYLAVTPPEVEARDFAILRIWHQIKTAQHAAACRALITLSSSPAPWVEFEAVEPVALAQTSSPAPWVEYWANSNFIALAAELDEKQSPEFAENVRTILESFNTPRQTANSWYSYARQSRLATIAEKFGFTDLAKTFNANSGQSQTTRKNKPSKPTPHSVAPLANQKSSSHPRHQNTRRPQPLSHLERFQKFAGEGKNTAAAHEFLQWFRKEKPNARNIASALSNLKSTLTPEIRTAILTTAMPKSTPGISRRLEFIDLCHALGESDRALTMLRQLAAERPFDPAITIQFAIALPPDEIDTATRLLTRAATAPSFIAHFENAYARIISSRDEEAVLALYDLFTTFLETVDPAKLNTETRSRFTNHSQRIIQASDLRNVPKLLDPKTDSEQSPAITVHREISRRLAFAALRHPTLAWVGFRIIHAADWIDDPTELDQLARQTLRHNTHINLQSHRNHSHNFLNEKSAANWIHSRLTKTESPADIIPPDFLTAIAATDPHLPALLNAFVTLQSAQDLPAFWNSNLLWELQENPSVQTLRQHLITHIAALPDASTFFLSRIRSLAADLDGEPLQPSAHYTALFHAALESCAIQQNEKLTREICSAIITATYGPNPSTADNQRANQTLPSILNNLALDPVTTVHITRTLDAHRIPIRNDRWLRTAINRANITTPAEAIALLDAMGMLDDTPDWHPIAYHQWNRQNSRDPFAVATINRRNLQNLISHSTSTHERIALDSTITRDILRRVKSAELKKQLLEREPQTFGSLLTAAALESGQDRQRLTLKAFKHAAPYLAKASPESLEDFALYVQDLPYDAIDILPPALQQKVQTLRDQKIANLLTKIESQFDAIATQPNQNPFGLLNNLVPVLSEYDLEKSAELFLRAEAIFFKNIDYVEPEHTNNHEAALNRILYAIQSNKNTPPEAALRFYHNIRQSPQSDRFGIGTKHNNSTYLNLLGDEIHDRFSEHAPEEKPEWLQPWLAINTIPKEFHNLALAAITCRVIDFNLTTKPDEVREKLDQLVDLPAPTRKLILACATLSNFRNAEAWDHDENVKIITALFNDPIFDHDARTQIALTAALRNPIILTSPKITAVVAKIFADYCERPRSAVGPIPLIILRHISKLESHPDLLPHMTKISAAFWDNARATKPGGHLPIPENDTKHLLKTAIHLGDHETTKLLLRELRPTLIGDIDIIVSLILHDQFQSAATLLPDAHGNWLPKSQIKTFPDTLEQKLAAFHHTSTAPQRLLRFESQLFIRLHQLRQAEQEQLAELRERLLTTFFKNPPTDLRIRAEILTTLIATAETITPNLEKEILDLATALDPTKTIHDYFDITKSGNPRGLPEEALLEILYRATNIQFARDDPTRTITIANYLTRLLKQTPIDQTSNLRRLIDLFADFSLDATRRAVATNHTQSFAQFVHPLRDLALAAAQTRKISSSTIRKSLTLHDFISHWENQPEDIPQILEKIDEKAFQRTIRELSFPRDNFPFLNALPRTPSHKLNPVDEEKFLIALLSHPPISRILVTRNAWLNQFETDDLRKTIYQLADSLPKSFSPTGRALMQWRYIVPNTVNDDFPASYHAILKATPDTPEWNHYKTEKQIHQVSQLMSNNHPAEARIFFDSIDPKNVQGALKRKYQSAAKAIHATEAVSE